jgi:ERCC4-related helicase
VSSDVAKREASKVAVQLGETIDSIRRKIKEQNSQMFQNIDECQIGTYKSNGIFEVDARTK